MKGISNRNTTTFFPIGFLIAVFLLGQMPFSFAQLPSDRDSLWNDYNTAVEDTSKVLLLLDIGYTYLRTNPDSAKILNQRALELADSIFYVNGKASALLDLGLIEWVKGKYPEALEKMKSALTLHESLGNNKDVAKCLNNIGLMYYESGQYTEAIENHKAYLEIVVTNGDKKREAGALHNIGMVHQAKGDYSDALEYYLNSVTVKKELGDSSRLSNTLDAVGDIHFELKEYQLAHPYYQRGLKIREKEGNKLGMVVSWYNIGRNYKEQGKYEEGLTVFRQGKRMADELANPVLKAYHLEGIGSIYKKTGQYEKALSNYGESLELRGESSAPKGYSLLLNEIADLYIQLEEWDKAFEKAEASYEIASSLQIKEETKDAALYLSKVYGHWGNYEKSYQLLTEVDELKDSLFNMEKNREMVALQLRHEIENKEIARDKERQASELHSQRKFIGWLSSALGLIVLLSTSLFFAYRHRRRTNKQLVHKNKELQNLNKELRSINQQLELVGQKLQQFAFAASHDLKESIRSVTSFGQLLEKKIKNAERVNPVWLTYLKYISSSGKRMDKILVDLLSYLNLGAKSLDFVKFDLNETIHDVQVALQSEITRTDTHIEVSNLPSLVAHPNLIEQLFLNLIDNAIKFRKKDVPLKIEIGTERDERNNIVFYVKDNGIGIEKRYLDYIFKPFKRLHDRDLSGSGLGLSICKNIVKLYNGTFKVDSRIDHGSIFRFTLPKAKIEASVKELISENIS